MTGLSDAVSQRAPFRPVTRPRVRRPTIATELPVLALVTTLVVVRFFTERLGILPRFLNGIDLFMVPLLLPVAAIFWIVWPLPARSRGIAFCCGLFTAAWAVSWIVNSKDVHWLGAAFLIVGLLTPILFYLIVVNLPLSSRFPDRADRLLLVLLVVNCIIGTFDAIRSFGTMRDDFIFGTFGVNQNQLAFFYAVMMAYLLGRWRFGLLSSRGKVLAIWAAVLFILCGFQTLWVIFVIAVAIVHIVITGIDRRLLGLVMLFVLIPIATLSAFQFQRFSVRSELVNIVEHFQELGKVQLVKHVYEIIHERPSTLVWGVGPAVFNSRAFRNIAIVPYPDQSQGATDVAAAVVKPFFTSDLSARYIIPYFTEGVFRISGANTDGPFTSYVSIPVEVGLLGALPLCAIYGFVLLSLARDARGASDPKLRITATWALSVVLMLLGISTVDNYLEVTRYTLLVWLTVALWYLRARHAASPLRSMRGIAGRSA